MPEVILTQGHHFAQGLFLHRSVGHLIADGELQLRRVCSLGGFVEVCRPVGEDVQTAFQDLQPGVLRCAGFPCVARLRGVEHRKEIAGVRTDVRIIPPGMLGVIRQQIDAGLALVLRLIV